MEEINKDKLRAIGLAVPTLVTSPVLAQTGGSDPVTGVTTMVTSLGAITTAVVAIILGAMGVRLAIKQVNRLMTKG